LKSGKAVIAPTGWRERDMAKGITHVIHYDGRGGPKKMRKARATALEQAGLATDDPTMKVTPIL
jgi:hypothetical protein